MTTRWIQAGLMLAGAALAAGAGTGVERSSARIPRAVHDYAAALERLPRAQGTAVVESLYTLGMQAADRLVLVLEDLDDTTFARVQSTMRGFALFRDETLGDGALPDASFFTALARARGLNADTAFFHAMTATHPYGTFPIYVRQQTDYSGCTDYGSGRLVATYGLWQAFIARYPGRYATWATEELENVEEELTIGNCACGDRASVLKEMEAFVQRFPHATIAPRVRERASVIRAKADSIRYQCVSG